MTNVLNMELVHDQYGTGKLKEFKGPVITVRFADGNRQFWFPDAYGRELREADAADKQKIQELISRWEAVFPPEKMEEYKARYYLSVEIARRKTLPVISEADEAKYQALLARYEQASARLKELEGAQKKHFSNGQSYFTGGAFAYFGIHLLSILVSFISLGLALPFIRCWELKWVKEHTFIDGKQLSFDGTGKELFKKYILWYLLSIVTLGVYTAIWLPYNMTRWEVSHTHLAGESGDSQFDASVWQLFRANLIASLVTCVSFGLGSFWAHCYRLDWIARHTVYGGARLRFLGLAWDYFDEIMSRNFLRGVTLGIYSFWYGVRMQQWTVSNLHIQ